MDYLSYGWLGTIVGIVGTVFGILGWKAAVTKQRLMYYSSSINLIEKNVTIPKELKLFFSENEVTRLTRTSFVLFKTGNQTILGSNIIKEDPLRLEFAPETEILDYSITKITREAIDFKVNKTANNVLEMNFKFLDSKDGICMTILHTGDNTVPEFTGTIMGLPDGLHEGTNRVDGGFFGTSYSKVIKTSFVACYVTMFILILYSAVNFYFFPNSKDVLALFAIANILFCSSYFIYRKVNGEKISSKIPKKLRSNDMNT